MINVIRTAALSAAATPFHHEDYDVVPAASKTASAFANRRPDLETGKDRVYAMYTVE